MQIVERYQAEDGTFFEDAALCVKHENLCRVVDLTMAPLGERLANAPGWIQHAPEVVVQCRMDIMELCREQGLAKMFPVFLNQDAHPMSAVGRILDDIGGPLRRAWGRFATIDEQGREHNQPYYAINGPAAEHVCIEDRVNSERNLQ